MTSASLLLFKIISQSRPFDYLFTHYSIHKWIIISSYIFLFKWSIKDLCIGKLQSILLFFSVFKSVLWFCTNTFFICRTFCTLIFFSKSIWKRISLISYRSETPIRVKKLFDAYYFVFVCYLLLRILETLNILGIMNVFWTQYWKTQ